MNDAQISGIEWFHNRRWGGKIENGGFNPTKQFNTRWEFSCEKKKTPIVGMVRRNLAELHLPSQKY